MSKLAARTPAPPGEMSRPGSVGEAAGSRSMVRSSIGMISGRAASLALGFVFWLLAARLFPPATVGLTAGAVSSMMLCTQLALLGVGSAFIARFPKHQEAPASLLDTAISIVSASSVATGAAFLLLSSVALRELRVVADSPVYAALFLAMCVLGTLNILFDQVSMALGRGVHVLIRNVFFGAVAAALLVALSWLAPEAGSAHLFSLWVAAGATACVTGSVQLWRSLSRYRFRPRARRTIARELVRFGIPNHLLTLTERAPGLVLPVVVIELLSPADNAFWYTVWMMAWVVYIVPLSMGMALFAEASHRPELLGRAIRSGLRSSLVLGVLGGLGLFLLGGLALGLLGPQYEAAGVRPLRILVVAVVPLTFVQVYFAACRARGKLAEAIVTGAVSGAVAVAAAAVVATRYGLEGMAWAWVATQGVTGVWALVRLVAFGRRPSPAATPPEPAPAPADGAARAPRAGRAVRRAALAVPAMMAGGALALWRNGLEGVDLRAMNDLGLVSVLPPSFYGALAILTVSFCLLLRFRPVPIPLVVAHLVVLVVMAYGVTTVVEEVPRLNVSWRHAGIIDHIMVKHQVDPRIDAYFNWPGFFILGALVTRLAGYESAMRLVPWAPVFFNLIFLFPVVMILRAATRDDRLLWLGTWFFALTNWVNQDYFSPQAVAYFLYLVVLAILVTWFRSEPTGPRHALRDPDPLPSSDGAQRAVLLVVITLVFAFMVPTHQLTPFATLAAVSALVCFGQCRARGLPVLMGVMLVTWISFMAVAFLAGRIETLAAAVGEVSENATANVGERLQGSPDHVFVVRARLAMTAGLWGVAFLGAIRRWSHGTRDYAFWLLAAAPFPLVALQSYGGEMLLRVYLFALPFMAMFAAGVFYPSTRSLASWTKTAATAGASLVLLAGFLVSRYGNERINQFTRNEVRAVETLYDVAPRGALLLAGTVNLPWKHKYYDDYQYLTMQRVAEERSRALPTLSDLVSVVTARPPSCAFVIVTRSQKAHADLLAIWPPGSLDELEVELGDSGLFRVVYSNSDAAIFQPSAAATAGASNGEVLAGVDPGVDCGR